MMRICVAGWYFDRFDEFYQVMHRIYKQYPVYVVANRDSDYLQTLDVPWVIRENTGLEWGAYNYYLTRCWPEDSSVLFMHDDIRFRPFLVDHEVKPPEAAFDALAQVVGDQIYVFCNRTEDAENRGQHGRAWIGSKRFLEKAKAQGGFFYDRQNRGHVSEDQADLREQMGCLGYNSGINQFHIQAELIGGDVHRRVYCPALLPAVRGN